MIQLTDRAIAELKKIAKQEKLPAIIRVGLRGGGCAGFTFDLFFDEKEPKESDFLFEFDGVNVKCDSASYQFLEGTEIDFISGVMSSGFKFNNPKIVSTCGCGNSAMF